ncbi:MAG: acyl-CoA dehydratase activase [Spirochaetales bacterium]|jgi:predicted CoA-substrate-specific enzyme activase|nr:acyl-CoA dehydratase activase [Spirochaetales bacterium]
MKSSIRCVGIDIGSTTVKIVVLSPDKKNIDFSLYRRHNAEQAQAVHELLCRVHELFPDSRLELAVCGSGGLSIAQALGAHYVQEVVANAVAIKEFYPRTSVAIELGGQDAKVVFFRKDPVTKKPVASDMRMNGSCAGGTGAFIDQVAELLHVPIEEFNGLAAGGQRVYEISGRCGVFAKTDIQPLLNQGASKQDLALSAFHAIAKQTIGGLAQGMEITFPVIFEGGPLTFNPVLVRVFQERLGLRESDIIIPESPELIIALGAAHSVSAIFQDKPCSYNKQTSLTALKNINQVLRGAADETPFFTSVEERTAFRKKYDLPPILPKTYEEGTLLPVYIGIDAGSTTSKFILMNEAEELINSYYMPNRGEPLAVIKAGLIAMRDAYAGQGVRLRILGVGTTGYGEILFAKAFGADYHTVETVSHAAAAQKLEPDVSFILDIGGQDMKAISLQGGIVTGITLNEACSAGCGSFLETYAASLGVPVDQIANMAFQSQNPSRLGSRCTVFMNSSIITEQKNGKTLDDILAGLCRSIIENVFTKVIRMANLDALGKKIVVQGGTFRNDAVFRAFQQYTGKEAVRPAYPGLMGAIGIALLTKNYIERKIAEEGSYTSSFIDLGSLESFDYEKKSGLICPFCQNSCNRSLVSFQNGGIFITGNRCERGEILGNASDPEVRKQLARASKKIAAVPDIVKRHAHMLTTDYAPRILAESRNIRIGIPRVLEFWESMPYWKTLFTSLGFEVVLSRCSSYSLFEKGLKGIPSDTVCFPAKLGHGHVQDLIEQGVDRIFWPMVIRVPKGNRTAQGCEMCPVVQGYPMVVEKSDEPLARQGIPMDHPAFHWYTRKLKHDQTVRYIHRVFGIPKPLIRIAITEAEIASSRFDNALRAESEKIIAQYSTPAASEDPKSFAVILSGRPYHSDELVNHGLSSLFTSQGIPVLALQFLPNLHLYDLSQVRMESYNPYHSRMIEAAFLAAHNPNIELVQIVSFGCGHDAIISDEMARVLKEISGKELLVLKLDEGEAKGPLSIRIRSFIETVRAKRQKRVASQKPYRTKELDTPFKVKFDKQDKKTRTILIPNLSPAFSYISAKLLDAAGYKTRVLKVAGKRAIELGKKYVHNDICFPAQVNIGEILEYIESGETDSSLIAAGLAKNCVSCRAGHYAALCRKALDEAGYPQIPIITTSVVDNKNMHPGFSFSLPIKIRLAWSMKIIDYLETMLRRVRPYEVNPGETDKAFRYHLTRITELLLGGHRKALRGFEDAVEDFNRIPITGPRKPRVGIVGEILMNYHPGSNGHIEEYLEKHGMEICLPGMYDFFREENIAEQVMARRRDARHPFFLALKAAGMEGLMGHIHETVARRFSLFRFAEQSYSIKDIAANMEGVIDHTFQIGEGWLMPGEIIQLAKHGINSFVILNPFGCLPNHISGRGMIKTLKKFLPHIQILALDYDPDTSFANVENRLQMLIITARELEKRVSVLGAQAPHPHR